MVVVVVMGGVVVVVSVQTSARVTYTTAVDTNPFSTDGARPGRPPRVSRQLADAAPQSRTGPLRVADPTKL